MFEGNLASPVGIPSEKSPSETGINCSLLSIDLPFKHRFRFNWAAAMVGFCRGSFLRNIARNRGLIKSVLIQFFLLNREFVSIYNVSVVKWQKTKLINKSYRPALFWDTVYRAYDLLVGNYPGIRQRPRFYLQARVMAHVPISRIDVGSAKQRFAR